MNEECQQNVNFKKGFFDVENFMFGKINTVLLLKYSISIDNREIFGIWYTVYKVVYTGFRSQEVCIL